MLRFVVLVGLAACGRLDFDPHDADRSDAATAGDADAAPLRVVFDDEFGDNDPGVNMGGVGAGVHAEGALIYEADTVLHYGNYDGDYASSGAITLDAFAGATTRRIEWDVVPGRATSLVAGGPEFGFELVAVALSAGNTNFNGELYFNTTGSVNASIAFNLEGDRVVAHGRVIATDRTKPSACNVGCAGMVDTGTMDWGDMGSVGSVRIHVVLDIDASGFRYSFEPPPTIQGEMGATYGALAVQTGFDLAPGLYVAMYGGNDFVGRAEGAIDRVRVLEP